MQLQITLFLRKNLVISSTSSPAKIFQPLKEFDRFRIAHLTPAADHTLAVGGCKYLEGLDHLLAII